MSNTWASCTTIDSQLSDDDPKADTPAEMLERAIPESHALPLHLSQLTRLFVSFACGNHATKFSLAEHVSRAHTVSRAHSETATGLVRKGTYYAGTVYLCDLYLHGGRPPSRSTSFSPAARQRGAFRSLSPLTSGHSFIARSFALRRYFRRAVVVVAIGYSRSTVLVVVVVGVAVAVTVAQEQ